MEVVIEPDAAAQIRERGGHLVLFQAKITGCCGIGSALDPMMEVGLPQRPTDQYRLIDIDGITVHVENGLNEQPGTLRVALTRSFWWKSFSLTREGGYSL